MTIGVVLLNPFLLPRPSVPSLILALRQLVAQHSMADSEYGGYEDRNSLGSHPLRVKYTTPDLFQAVSRCHIWS